MLIVGRLLAPAEPAGVGRSGVVVVLPAGVEGTVRRLDPSAPTGEAVEGVDRPELIGLPKPLEVPPKPDEGPRLAGVVNDGTLPAEAGIMEEPPVGCTPEDIGVIVPVPVVELPAIIFCWPDVAGVMDELGDAWLIVAGPL